VIDSLTGYGIIRPMVGKSADEMGECLLHIFSDYGPPKWIQSDNGTEFSNQVVSTLLNKISTSFRFSAAYCPSSNGVAERFIGHVKAAIAKKKDEEGLEKNEWSTVLPMLQLEMNRTYSVTLGASPFELLYGRVGKIVQNEADRTIVEVSQYILEPEVDIPQVEDELSGWVKHRKALDDDMPQIYSARVANKNKRLNKLNERNKATDKILNNNTQVLVRDHTRWFGDNKFIGPYRIANHDGTNYSLKECDSEVTLNRRVPRRDLKLFSIGNKNSLPKDSYIVESINGVDKFDGVEKFHIKWQGYSQNEMSWEPAENFDDPSIIDKYKIAHSIDPKVVFKV